MSISAQQVKELREVTRAGMMECKAALQEAEGDFEKAVVILRKKGLAAAAQKAARIASEGLVVSYIHPGARIGVLVELNCETDFVAKTPEFQELARDIAMHIAALDPKYNRKEDVPVEVLEQEKEIYRAKAKAAGKPPNVIEKIVEGQLQKFYSECCVYEQPFVKDENMTIGQLISEKIVKTKENINLRRFVRFKVGEGLQKRSDDFAGEVAAQLK
ncbi:MAG: translation elongation factor Ts [Acidobacteria bacterium]|nr:MAG: translation elongation factor Ts [Acidobacteriota bacterium]